MPELPEVEVCRMGITPHLINQKIESITVRNSKLRWAVSPELMKLRGEEIQEIKRRGKYLLIETEKSVIVIHLGMSGTLRILDKDTFAEKHDHVDMILSNKKILRYNDPRRFGSWLWYETDQPISVLQHLGVEPLTAEFTSEYLQAKAQKRKIGIKQFIMDNKVVVGVGNIYANESLFSAKIHPEKPINTLSFNERERLVVIIKQILKAAIKQGGTTLKDFTQTDGRPGYFAQELQVYGKAKQECPCCSLLIEEKKIGQRNSFFCNRCQIL